MNLYRQFTALIWKQALLYLRHYIFTAIQIIIPIVLSSFLVYLKSDLNSGPIKHVNETLTLTEQPLVWAVKTIYGSNKIVAFIPNDTVTNNLIHKTFEILNTTLGSEAMDAPKIMGFETEGHWENYIISMENKNLSTSDIVLITVNQLETVENAPKFSYSLGFKPIDMNYKKFDTTKLYPAIFEKGLQQSFWPYKTTGFISLQSALSLAFIKMIKNDTNIKVLSQEMPYPSYQTTELGATLLEVIPIVLVCGFCILLPLIVKNLVEEKVNLCKEMMKMMGMNMFNYWMSNFVANLFIVTVISVVVNILYFVPLFGPNTLIEHSDFSLVLLLLILFGMSTILFAFVVSIICNKTTLANFAIIIFWNLAFLPAFVVFKFGDPITEEALYIKVLCCLLPPMGLHLGFKIIAAYESFGVGLTWSNINKIPFSEGQDGFNMAWVMSLIILSCLIYAFLIWYLDNVWPWQPGVPKSPFFFLPKFILPSDDSYLDDIAEYEPNTKYFEAEPTATPGIQIIKVTKCFNKTQQAVTNMTLNLYKNQITALLGPNGAGKTTTMKMITGLFPPGKGNIYINGYNIERETALARDSLGLCPQHNILYNYMTLNEHLKFFGWLKGLNYQKLNQDINELLVSLGLEAHNDKRATALSGGMKRKLSLAISIIGGQEVLILDEPTAGMDPESRRKVWDLLIKIRENRTVLLTTHYMEEADALGDRIAIMSKGKLFCCGSSMFLKKIFGAGYHLRIAFSNKDLLKLEDLTFAINEHVPEAILENVYLSEVTYALGNVQSSQLIPIFQKLEASKEQLGFSSFGIAITTMDDVFVKVGEFLEKEDHGDYEATSDSKSNSLSSSSPLLSDAMETNAFRRFCLIAIGLLLKRFHYTKRHWVNFFLQILLPSLTVLLLMRTVYNVNDMLSDIFTPPSLDIKLDFYHQTYSFYKSLVKDDSFQKYYVDTIKNSSIVQKISSDPQEFLIDVAAQNLHIFKEKWLIGGSLDILSPTELRVIAWYNSYPYHSLPIALNTMFNSVLRYMTNNTIALIELVNKPLPASLTPDPISDFAKQLQNKLLFSIFIPLAFTFLSSSFILLPIIERESKAKLLQKMTGINGFIYWLFNFLWDFFIHFICSIIILFAFISMDYRKLYAKNLVTEASLFLALLLYGWVSIPLTYLISYIPKSPATGFALITTMNLVSGLIMSVSFVILEFTQKKDLAYKLAWLFRFLPNFSISSSFSKISLLAVQNSECDNLDPDFLEEICAYFMNQKSQQCCSNCVGDICYKYISPISWNEDAAGREFLIMLVAGFLYFGIIILLEFNFTHIFHKIYFYLMSRKSNSHEILVINDSGDEDVKKEQMRVLGTEFQNPQDVLQVHNLTKIFGTFYAVDHLSFGVGKGEFFGLLGVNGAGKTTSFKMLTGDLQPSYGNAYIDSNDLKKGLNKFQKNIGYCPQFDAILDKLTGSEMLYLFARLRGIKSSHIPQMVDDIINWVDIKKHADKMTSSYSGGTKRKLSIGLSVIGFPNLIFLDEPTAGIDPISRRKIWELLVYLKKTVGLSFVLTSHSMEECEALCCKVAIMVNGHFKCLGSMQHLKTKFGKGYTVATKVQMGNQDNDIALTQIKNFIAHEFEGSELISNHQGFLEFQVKLESTTLAQLFIKMEEAKELYDLEDFLISDASLEQIFLHFARMQDRLNDRE